MSKRPPPVTRIFGLFHGPVFTSADLINHNPFLASHCHQDSPTRFQRRKLGGPRSFTSHNCPRPFRLSFAPPLEGSPARAEPLSIPARSSLSSCPGSLSISLSGDPPGEGFRSGSPRRGEILDHPGNIAINASVYFSMSAPYNIHPVIYHGGLLSTKVDKQFYSWGTGAENQGQTGERRLPAVGRSGELPLRACRRGGWRLVDQPSRREGQDPEAAGRRARPRPAAAV